METYETDAMAKALDLTEEALEKPDHFTPPDPDTIAIDVDTYEEYAFTDTEMLEWVALRKNFDIHQTYMVQYKGRFAYTGKGPPLTEVDMEGLDFHDTFRGAIQSEMLKEREVLNETLQDQ